MTTKVQLAWCAFFSVVGMAGLVQGGLYSSAVINAGPVAYWRLGEASPAETGTNLATGPASVGAAANATYLGAGHTLGLPSLIGDPLSTAVRFSGNASLTAPGFEKFAGGTGSTVEFFFRPDALPAAGFVNLVGDGQAGGDFNLMVYLSAAGEVRAHNAAPGGMAVTSSAPNLVTPGQTYHVAGTWNDTSNQLQLYLNGKSVAGPAATGVGAPANTNNPIYIGKDVREQNLPAGGVTLDEVAIYNKPLTKQQVVSHAVAGGVPLSLSTHVLGPGVFSSGTFGNQDGYTDNTSVELIGAIQHELRAAIPVTRQVGGPVANFSFFTSDNGTAGSWGSDTHGRAPANLWHPGDGESNVVQPGFGAHANKFITFDLNDVRGEYLLGAGDQLQLTGKYGMNGSADGGAVNPGGVSQGSVWLDGVLINASPDLSQADPSHDFTLVLPTSGRYLTLAITNGNASSFWDDGSFRNVDLQVLSTPQTVVRSEFTTAGFAALSQIPQPSSSDYADASSGNGVTFNHVSGALHPAGATTTVNLNDGIAVASPPNNQTFLMNDAGQEVRVQIDLNGLALVEQFNSYGITTVDGNRAYQSYSLYGTTTMGLSVVGDPELAGWTLIADVLQAALGTQQEFGVSIDNIDSVFSELLWVGKPHPNFNWGAHYVEFDVIASQFTPVPEPSSFVLLGAMLVGAAGVGYRRRKQRAVTR